MIQNRKLKIKMLLRNIRAAPSENVASGPLRTAKVLIRLCAAQSDRGLRYPLLVTESLDNIECINGEQRPG